MNIWESNANILVIPSNGVGAVGAGLAAQAAKRYPMSTRPYQQACWAGQQAPGQLLYVQISPTQQLCFLPTKRHWRQPSRLEDVVAGLRMLGANMREYTWMTVALPPIGCGLGGLRWESVEPIVRELLVMERVELVGHHPAPAPTAPIDPSDEPYDANNPAHWPPLEMREYWQQCLRDLAALYNAGQGRSSLARFLAHQVKADLGVDRTALGRMSVW